MVASMIEESLLITYGAKIKKYKKNEYVFKEGQKARYYYQVSSGEVKMNNFLENGKEFVQSFFNAPRSFGEPPLFSDILYPANAVATKDSEILQLEKTTFLNLLRENPDIHLKVTEAIALRLYYKAIMATEISSQEPEHCILRVLDYLKKDVYGLSGPFSFKVNLTRQQIAHLTGLRVETVIRATKSLEKKNELLIKNRKLYR
ncbi:Crp/Fnr family transcriptional regulator [Galbibacter sp. PAP.153]|uniref:Crp/Fnr family transcriptional regulator n=1 Tax=Galbibacter sp. PAP.153 TaxID=3104623 RepID=UPI00300ABE64